MTRAYKLATNTILKWYSFFKVLATMNYDLDKESYHIPEIVGYFYQYAIWAVDHWLPVSTSLEFVRNHNTQHGQNGSLPW
jgi:hypothetical protein